MFQIVKVNLGTAIVKHVNQFVADHRLCHRLCVHLIVADYDLILVDIIATSDSWCTVFT